MKLLSVVAMVLGAGATFVFFVLWAGNGLPYQDPTPEMLKAQELRGYLFGAGVFVSVLIASLGGRTLWVGRRRSGQAVS